MADLLQKLEELAQRDPGQHLLCIRIEGDDALLTEDVWPEPNDAQDRLEWENHNRRLQEANDRTEKFLDCLVLLSYDDAAEKQAELWQMLETDLAHCDICIRKYHQGKERLREKLAEDYDEEAIKSLFDAIEAHDFSRLMAGLDAVKDRLLALPPNQRRKKALGANGLSIFYEALTFKALLQDQDQLAGHFDEPFALVQSIRPLQLPDVLPASVRFLFDKNAARSSWALQAWQEWIQDVTAQEFAFSVKDALDFEAKQVVTVGPQQYPEAPIFWRAVFLILDRVDTSLLKDCLPSLEADIPKLILDYLGIRTSAFVHILRVLRLILVASPNRFWDTAQTASPKLIIQTTFMNSQFRDSLSAAEPGTQYESSDLFHLFAWIPPFLHSLPNENQAAACQEVLRYLFDQIQENTWSQSIKYYSFRAGVEIFASVLERFQHDSQTSSKPIPRAILGEILNTVAMYIKPLLHNPKFEIDAAASQQLASISLSCISHALLLEGYSLKLDYEILVDNRPFLRGNSTHSAELWNNTIMALNDQRLDLCSVALKAFLPLVGLERFTGARLDSKDKEQFNATYGEMCATQTRIIEKMADFSTAALNSLFASPDACSGLVFGLVTADSDTYNATIELYKTFSDNPVRKDALAFVLNNHFERTINAFAWSFSQIAKMQTFESAPRMVKTATDVVEILCDLQNGILRTRTELKRTKGNALVKFWENLWKSLNIIFVRTESWHNRGKEREDMLNFCRDTMQAALYLIDEYETFAAKIAKGPDVDELSVRKRLLEAPNRALAAMAKWARLRDVYLASKLNKLLCKVLKNFTKFEVVVSKEALDKLDRVANGTSKTVISRPERANLATALAEYLGNDDDAALASDLPTTNSRQNPRRHHQQSIMGFVSQHEPGSSAAQMAAINQRYEETRRREQQEIEDRFQASIIARQAEEAARQKTNAEKKNDFLVNRQREKRERRDHDLAMIKQQKDRLRGPTSGGSALGSIGVTGKDHGKQEKSLLISSDSESSDEDDDDDPKQLFGHAKKPDSVRYAEEMRARRANPYQGPVRKTRQIRSTKDLRARIAPDLSGLHRTILSWDYFAETDLPPNSSRTDYKLVTNTFKFPQDYQNTFEGLLLLEAWQGFRTAREEGNMKSFAIHVSNRMSLDQLVEINTTMDIAAVRDFGLGDSDIVLLSRSEHPTRDPEVPHALARVTRIVRKAKEASVSYRSINGTSLSNSLGPGTKIYACKITSLTPLEREYGALSALPFYDLCDEVVNAKISPMLKYNESQYTSLMKTYKLNAGQARAIKSALDNDAFTLIQGPPGSGKTKTIVALTGAILSNQFVGVDPSVAIQAPVSAGQRAKRPMGKKLLICAPSNAAVDELVMRLKQGITTVEGKTHIPSLVRLGRSDAINKAVKDVTLEELVNAALRKTATPGVATDMGTLMAQHKSTSAELVRVRDIMDALRNAGDDVPPTLIEEFQKNKRIRATLASQIDSNKDKANSDSREQDMFRRKIQQEVIDNAHIICATLSGSGHDMFQHLNIDFETVIIDEAAQCIELSALIPLKYGCSKCIMVGDPKQLPPTVLSRAAAKFQYEQSLFVRMQANHPKDVHLLDTQYRMHPEISRFPSQKFYDGRLMDGPDMAKLRRRPWHQNDLLGPYRFYDVEGMHSSAPAGHSLINVAEIKIAMQMYERVTNDCKGYDFTGKIGIITPYKGQLKELKRRFSMNYGEEILSRVDFNTTDAFQGRECEIIIFSCVRASTKGIGFLSDIRRMNVGLTRAKSSLWVLGNSKSLMQGEFWAALIEDARERKLFTAGNGLDALKRPMAIGMGEVDMDDASFGSASEKSVKAESVGGSSRRSSSGSTGMGMKNGLIKTEVDTIDRKRKASDSFDTTLENGRNKKMSRSPSETTATKAGPSSSSSKATTTTSRPSFTFADSLRIAAGLQDPTPMRRMSEEKAKAEAKEEKKEDTSTDTNTKPASGSGPAKPAPRPIPPMRKRKPVDPFIRPKKRPNQGRPT